MSNNTLPVRRDAELQGVDACYELKNLGGEAQAYCVPNRDGRVDNIKGKAPPVWLCAFNEREEVF